jgi:undecaprenyl pyrophosphate synthase
MKMTFASGESKKKKTDRWNRVSSWMEVVMAANGRVAGFPRMKKKENQEISGET